MEILIISKEEFNALVESIGEIKTHLANQNKKSTEPFIDNQEFLAIMNISKRTAQNWRDKGIIPFTQISNKVYYKKSDVDALMQTHYNRTPNKKGGDT